MHIHIEQEYLPLDNEEFEYYDSCWRVWHGTWSFLADAHWYSKTRDITSAQREHERYNDWSFNSRVLLKPESTTSQNLNVRFLASTCEEALRQIQQMVLTGRYQQYKDSPKEFTLNERTRVAEVVQTMQFMRPEYPEWAIPIPVAVFGDPPAYSTRIGHVFYPISHEFAVEIFVEAWTSGSEPTNQELEQIHNILTQQTKANP
jgi:hypothetical protein